MSTAADWLKSSTSTGGKCKHGDHEVGGERRGQRERESERERERERERGGGERGERREREIGEREGGRWIM